MLIADRSGRLPSWLLFCPAMGASGTRSKSINQSKAGPTVSPIPRCRSGISSPRIASLHLSCFRCFALVLFLFLPLRLLTWFIWQWSTRPLCLIEFVVVVRPLTSRASQFGESFIYFNLSPILSPAGIYTQGQSCSPGEGIHIHWISPI